MDVTGHTVTGSASQALRQGRGILVLAFVLSFFVNVLRLAGPIFMILIYDRVLPSRSEETLVALFAMVVVLLMAQGVIDYARRRILARYGAQFQERLEAGLFADARQGDLFEQGRTKPVAGLDEVDGLRGFFHSSSLISIYDFFWTPIFVAVVFVLDPRLGWVCMGGMAVILCLVLIQMAFVGNRATNAASASRGISDLKTMMAASRDTIRSQEMSRSFKNRWVGARSHSRDQAIVYKDWTVWFESLSDVVVLITRYSVLAVGAWLTLHGTLTIGAMVAATFLVARTLVPVEKFLTELPRIAEARRNWTQLKRVLAANEAEGSVPAPIEAGNPRARLSLANVSVRSPMTGLPLLKGVTLDVAPGQMVEIVGPSGKGKTVLAETIVGLWKRSGGMILVNGLNVARLKDADNERLIGYIPESPGFVQGTLAENISHLDPHPDMDKVTAAAKKACLHALISALPEGYETVIDPVGSGFSRGQRSQLALARAVYNTPELLVIDDLDPMLFSVLPKTMDKTIDQHLKSGGSILIFTRQRLGLRQIIASYEIDDGKLKVIASASARAVAPSKVTAISDGVPKKRPAEGGPISKLIRS